MHMREYKLSDIYIGQADGETESNNDKFIDMFYTGNNKCEELNQDSKYIITGRKGTGKTVLAKYYLYEQSKNNGLLVSKYGNLKDLSLHELIEFGDISLSRKIMFNFQQFYIFKEIACMLIQNKKSLREFKFNPIKYVKYRVRQNTLEKFYNEKYNNNIHEIITGTESSSNEIQTSLKGRDAGVDAKSINSVYSTKKEKEFYKIVDTIKHYVFDVLKYINILFIIDDFDDYFIDDKDKTLRFLIDFTINVKEINDFLYKISKNNRCIILLRDDVIDKFATQDSNIQKILIDSTVKLNWIEGSNQMELKKMICNKILNSNKEFKNMSISDVEKLFFPIDKHARTKGRKKHSKGFFNSVIELGFGRPRDVIVLLNIIKNKNPNNNHFTYFMINDALLDYSKHFIDELKNELSFHYDPSFIKTIFQVLTDFKKRFFNKEELELFLNTNEYNIQIDLETFINLLYKQGIIGYFIPKGKASKNGFYTWRYYSNATEDVDLNAHYSIHKGLRKGLNI